MKIIAAISTALLALVNTSHQSLLEPTATVEDLVAAPITFVTEADNPRLVIVGDVVAFDSLRIIVQWTHPTDSLGVEDSTFFRVKASKTIRFSGGGTIAPSIFRRRAFKSVSLADTFKVLRPAIGDSVIFQADSISQCRLNACSIPGSAGWGYRRSAKPPSMSFTKMTTDSF